MKLVHQLPMPPIDGFLGHVSYLQKPNVHQQLLKWVNEYGTSFRLKLGMKNALVLAEPELIKGVLKSRPDQFRRLKNIESVFDEAGLNGIFSAEGTRWKHQRKLTEPMFQPSHLKHFYPKLSIITERLQKRFSDLADSGEIIELLDEFKRYTVDVTSLLAFGEDFNSIEQTETPLTQSINHIFPMVNRRCKSPIPLWRFFKTTHDKQFDTSLTYVKHFVSGCIEKQRTLIATNPELAKEPENMLQIMITEQKKDATFSDQDILANAMTLLLAGEDTTANTLTWMSYLLCYNPKAEISLTSEFESLEETKYLAWPIPRLPYLTAVMYEAMRLKPVAPQLYIEPLSDTFIGSIKVKKGTPIFVMLHANGFNSDLFDSPESFSPERWLGKNRASFSNIQPFGTGARLCPGRSLAIMEIKLAFHALFNEFIIEPQQSADEVVENFAFTMSPVGFKVRLTKR
ncbi:cytochrome P450 [Photobacterium proteolyticum]|uniref:Cytochrome P450 n=1 Tax=Photobacterium proteolyticum TaxID=1903952 RepID=A0A1Q9GML7_9GAMM|nr:cytochrome P450 [Photobacterium proteolyticum]OLQ75727.1 cytochrome P450 [Photobacterium proteolyticum]